MKRYSPLVLVLSILMYTACTQVAEHERSVDESKGGLLTINQVEGFSTLHPPSSFESSAARLGVQVYESLMAYDPDSRLLVPALASSCTANDDNKVFTIEIRNDVHFHDSECFDEGSGRRMTADDVVYCLKVLCSKNKWNENKWLFCDLVEGGRTFFEEGKNPATDDLPGIVKISDNTVEIRLLQPNVEFPHLLAHYSTSIYPPELIQTYGDRPGDNPVGTGPFVMKTFSRDQACIMERNPRYWRQDENGNSLPYLAGLRIVFERDAMTMHRAIDKETVHLIQEARAMDNQGNLESRLEETTSGFSKKITPAFETVYLSFLNDTGVFSDKRVRRAFVLALDKDSIAARRTRNHDRTANHGLVPLGLEGYPYSSIQAETRSVETARQLLSDAGYPTGEGFPILTLQVQKIKRHIEMAQEIQRQLNQELGVILTLSTVSKSQHLQRIEDKKVEIWIDNWVGDYLSPYNFLNLMHSDNTPEGGASYLNLYWHQDETYDKILEQASSEANQSKRMDFYALADEQVILKNVAILPLCYSNNQYYLHNSVKGLSSPLFGRFDFSTTYIE